MSKENSRRKPVTPTILVIVGLGVGIFGLIMAFVGAGETPLPS